MKFSTTVGRAWILLSSLFAPGLYGVDIPVAADTQVDSAVPMMTAGTLPTLEAGATRTVYLAFRHQPYLAAGVSPNDLVQAKLRIYVRKTAVAGVSVLVSAPASVAFTETALNSFNAPEFGTAFATVSAVEKKSKEVDVTSIVRQNLALGLPGTTFALRAGSTGPNSITFDSKENGVTGHGPMLELIFTGP